MTNLQQHHTIASIRASFWRRYESAAEHEERADGAEEAAYRLFQLATKGQKAAHDRAMADLSGLSAPRYDRAHAAATAAWYATTAEARALFETSLADLMRDGEMSESTLDAWNALPDFVDMAEVA